MPVMLRSLFSDTSDSDVVLFQTNPREQLGACTQTCLTILSVLLSDSCLTIKK